ncbi:LLM class flavin-dependent oxidoreductase [Propioniciclava sp. MC1595]|uniref:LLM class flavin-dependent oxidoreductase n=1 Tax=Propioniciclava sp. MC1595 TaxID=2760308 RepID=UPI0016624A9A|nr:LLM class flavin-dependent oxidoreductase [Propioniciclava sp. MC1595]MBB1494545.1 LLM class flavin-dependent oxidoreductase [Propioniciclava sp. MC1595]QTE27456.1 LLM class flavin-dependent oxidoreductase [Propioniciclava sp. MC1595]
MSSVDVSVLDLATVRTGWSTSDALAATVEFARAADELGARRFWIAEHHNMPSVAATTPPVLIAAVAARTERIRVGSGGVMLPNHSPYVVAEQFAALEALYPGRIDLGIGRAPGADQVTAWALRRSQEGLGHEDFVEHLQLLQAWLSPRGVRVGMGMTLTATPAASGYPEVWLLGSSDYSARLAGKLGIRYAYAGHFGQFDPAAVFALYRDSFSPSEGLEAPHAMLCTSALVGATEEEAAYLAGPSTISWINIRRDTREALPSPEESARRIDAMGGVDFSGTKVVGTADQVRSRLEEMVADCEVQELMVLTTAYDVQTRIDTLAALV